MLPEKDKSITQTNVNMSRAVAETPRNEKALRALGTVMIVGLLIIVIYAGQAWQKIDFTAIRDINSGFQQFGIMLAEFVSVASVGVMIGGAALLLGGFLGFLFGIPRTHQQVPDEMQQEGNANQIAYQANTNLEQISDWLTKVLVVNKIKEEAPAKNKLESV